MLKLDNKFLEDLGLGNLPGEEKNRLLRHIYETLEKNVGIRLASQMSNEQLDEFEDFINRNDEPGALKWLETNFPTYKQVVVEELERLKNEVKQAAPQIMAAAQHAQAQTPPAFQPAQSPQPQIPPAPQSGAATEQPIPPAQPPYQPPADQAA